jgi:hypothetical protein
MASCATGEGKAGEQEQATIPMKEAQAASPQGGLLIRHIKNVTKVTA